MRFRFCPLFFLLLLLVFQPADAQKKKKSNNPSIPLEHYDQLQWRSIGPHRGGRSAAITGVPNQPNLFYMGTTGGGVWRTQDGGQTWVNLSDGYFGGSIGSVAVSEWDPNVIYVGGGEKTVRGNVSSGSGLWKSVDAGKTWSFTGLPNSRHVPRIRIHPKNPDLVYAAVLGDLYKPDQDRGVYRSKDGGKSWTKILFAHEQAGAVDLIMDPTNPRILFASTWNIRRTPYSLESGGPGSSLWKSTDGGDTWTNLKDKPGLPNGVWGISGVTVSPVNPERVWALIENENGGVYRSDDGGETWTLINKERKLRQRAWYYTRLYADTQDEDQLYVLNVRYHRSKDGGKTFETFVAPHGDHHDLWIAPENNQRMAIADDGGGQISFDGGENWSTYLNQPTAQFYRVTTDNAFPYRIYGAQQDNSTVRILHRSDQTYISERHWEPTAGGESAHIAPKPDNPEIVFGGSYGGFMTRINHATGEQWAVNVWPDNPMGHGAKDLKYRFQWNYPIFYSPHNADRLYTASNYLHVSTDGGQSWEVISPDLTRNDPTKLGASGGPITKDNTSVEYYCSIFAAAESPHEAGVIWTGSDDGLVHVTRDGGENWKNVTPPSLPEWSMINSVEVDPHRPGGLYLAATRYKMGDYQPLIFKTSDYGQTWTRITTGIGKEHFTRVVRADPVKKDILYAGTERGMYVSFNNGSTWQSLQNNLPIVPITDLAIRNNNLVAATQGRSFWLLDDLTVLHQLMAARNKPVYLYKPMETYRMSGGNGAESRTLGTNHPGGVLTHFFVKDTTNMDTLRIEFLTDGGQLIRAYSTVADKKENIEKLEVEPGINTMNWDMRYPSAESFSGMVLWGGPLRGPKVIPGTYRVSLTHGTYTQEQSFVLKKDPRSSATEAELKSQFELTQQAWMLLSRTHETIKDLREVRTSLNEVKEKLKDKNLLEQVDQLLEQMDGIEKTLYQTKNESPQDPLNFPIRLNNKLSFVGALIARGDHAPTKQSQEFLEEVSKAIEEQLAAWNQLVKSDLPALNVAVRESKIDAVSVPD